MYDRMGVLIDVIIFFFDVRCILYEIIKESWNVCCCVFELCLNVDIYIFFKNFDKSVNLLFDLRVFLFF